MCRQPRLSNATILNCRRPLWRRNSNHTASGKSGAVQPNAPTESRTPGRTMMGELALLAASALFAGVATGVLAGLFGIGGGAIIVPVLFEVFRLLGVPEAVRMQLCIGTSLAIIVPTALRSYRAHEARGFALPDVMRRWTLPSIAGVAVGSVL